MRFKITEKIKKSLIESDPKLATLVQKYSDIDIALATNYFESLASSIVGQQLSNKVADIIWQRLVAILGGKTGGRPSVIKAPSNYQPLHEFQVLPEAILASGEDELRSVGLSMGKINYLKNLSLATLDGTLDFATINEKSNEEVVLSLTKIKGIGRWTAEMFLIFSLGREDVFSTGDGGLFNAVKSLYELTSPTKIEVEDIAKAWSPYRTYASLYLWKSLDNA